MSNLFGVLHRDGATVRYEELRALGDPVLRYGTGEVASRIQKQVGMGLQPNHTHARSGLDNAPRIDCFENLLCFDGRLDNANDLSERLDLEQGKSDSQIVLAAFAHWGQDVFSYLIGDWALAIWSAQDKALYLARDHAGTRTLYYATTDQALLWSTHLEGLGAVVSTDDFCEEYALRYLSLLPVLDTTPYRSIRSVLPGHYLVVKDSGIAQRIHWRPISPKRIRYGTDREYEEQFRTLFAQSVNRRTGKGAPILAQLSGGMDSTAIICMSDCLRRSSGTDADLLDTVSYFDDSESTLNERKYFEITERFRGKQGVHLDTAFSRRTFRPHDRAFGSYLFPGADSATYEQEQEFQNQLWSKGYRSVLSGIGGDEVLGGIPIGTPELADYVMSLQWIRLTLRTFAWSVCDRRPVFQELAEVSKLLHHAYIAGPGYTRAIPSWLLLGTDGRTRRTRNGRVTLDCGRLGLPSAIDNAEAWWMIMESLPHLSPHILHRPEYLYPYLDKDLVTFLFSIPREQLLRPGRRRSLQRRALRGIMPTAIVERTQKAYQLRAPLRHLAASAEVIRGLFADPMMSKLGFVDRDALNSSVEAFFNGDTTSRQTLTRAIAYELWLRSNDRAASETNADGESAMNPSSLTA